MTYDSHLIHYVVKSKITWDVFAANGNVSTLLSALYVAKCQDGGGRTLVTGHVNNVLCFFRDLASVKIYRMFRSSSCCIIFYAM